MSAKERYATLLLMPTNHMGVAQLSCGCCLHPHLQVDVIGNVPKVSLASSIRKMSLCREHFTSK